MSSRLNRSINTDNAEAPVPVTAADVRLHLRMASSSGATCQKAPPDPLTIRFFAQLHDGSVREWPALTHMGQLVHPLRELLETAPQQRNGTSNSNSNNNGNNNGNNSSGTLRIPRDTVFVDPTPTVPSQCRGGFGFGGVSFFWLDMSGAPGPHDLDVLFNIIRVNPHTQRAWRADAARATRDSDSSTTDDSDSDVVINSSHISSSSSSSESESERERKKGNAYVNGSAVPSALFPLSGEKGMREMDQLHLYVAERYVHLLLSAIPCAPLPLPQPDRLHANLFDVGDESELTHVRVLCFCDGLVTWRPVPRVEGWARVAYSIAQRGPVANALTAAWLLHAVLDGLCAAFLPDPAAVLSEVDAIDEMMSVIGRGESDQADLLRRVLLLRQRLSVHRRLLLSKVNLLDQLGRPVMRTLLAFVTMDTEKGSEGIKRSTAIRPDGRAAENAEAEAQINAHASITHRILLLLRQIDNARTILGNVTIIHTSGVAMQNNSMSNETDYHSLVLLYVLIIVLPLTIVASHWGMNCWVPFQGLDSTKPFWIIFSCMIVYSVLLLSYPVYCWIAKKPHKLII